MHSFKAKKSWKYRIAISLWYNTGETEEWTGVSSFRTKSYQKFIVGVQAYFLLCLLRIKKKSEIPLPVVFANIARPPALIRALAAVLHASVGLRFIFISLCLDFQVFLMDLFGLKTLYARGDLILCSMAGVAHIFWHSNETVYKTCIEQWLT